MKDDEECQVWAWLESQHILEHKDEVVECDKAYNSYEVWVD